VIAVKRKAPEGFSIVVQRPFVVVANEPPVEVRRHATGTVQWAVDHLKQEYSRRIRAQSWRSGYSKTQPATTSTRRRSSATCGHAVRYFSHEHKALIMNIDTGTGTLVHEMVHPFIAATFPTVRVV